MSLLVCLKRAQRLGRLCDGPLMVVLVAGSGTNLILSQCIAHLICYHDADPTQILIAPFFGIGNIVNTHASSRSVSTALRFVGMATKYPYSRLFLMKQVSS